MRKFDIGVAVTVGLAIIGFAFWCGTLQGTVSRLDSLKAFEDQREKAIADINKAAKAATDKQSAKIFGFIEPINIVIGSQNLTKEFPVTYVAPSNQAQNFDISVSVPEGCKLVGAWYVPIGNIETLSAFETISASVSGKKHHPTTTQEL